MSPAVFGTKPPLLLAFGCLAGIPAALLAGLFADSLCSLPFGCSAVFFLGVSILARFFGKFSVPIVIVFAALFRPWLAVWEDGADANLLSGFLFALVPAIVVVPPMKAFLSFARHHAGIADGGEAK